MMHFSRSPERGCADPAGATCKATGAGRVLHAGVGAHRGRLLSLRREDVFSVLHANKRQIPTHWGLSSHRLASSYPC
eukprot:6167875-Prymnesium_polylepis.1